MVKTSLMLHSILSICSFIDSDKIVVPTFQRQFVWSKNNVANLLTSIYKGYPIGTIIVLDESPSRFKALSLKDFKPINNTEKSSYNSLWYLLDGSQRLVGLYRSLFSSDPKFSFTFNLDTEEFLPKSKRPTSEGNLDLHSLFSPDLFLQFQKSISLRDNSEFLLDRAYKLHNTLSGYELPIQVISNLTLDDAMSIFEVINNSGQQLQKSDIEKLWQKDE